MSGVKKKTPATPLEKAESEVSKLTGMIDNAVKQAADLGITEKQAKDSGNETLRR